MPLPLETQVGFSFPFRRGRNYFSMSAGEQLVRESVVQIVGTEQGERPMRPTFGVRMKRLVFSPNDVVLADGVKYEIETALRLWEPRVEVLGVDVGLNRLQNFARYTIGIRIKATGNQVDDVVGELQLRTR